MKNRNSKRTKSTTPAQEFQSFTFPVSRAISCDQAYDYLYEGMVLRFKRQEFHKPIAITAYYFGEHRVVGFLPVGMQPHLDELLLDENSYCVQLECMDCERLENSMWITVDALPQWDAIELALIA